MNADVSVLRAGLSDCFWLGGMSRSGKSSTAQILADRYDFTILARDDFIKAHWAQVDATSFPAMYGATRVLNGDEPEWTEFAANPIPEVVDRFFWSFVQEDWTLTLEDLKVSLPEISNSNKPVLIEGARMPPQGVAELLTDLHRATWLAPSRDTIGKRLTNGWGGVIKRFADPVAGHRRVTEIFYAVSEKLAEEAEEHRLGVVRTKLADSVTNVATKVARTYGV